jgi:hypothetical protein
MKWVIAAEVALLIIILVAWLFVVGHEKFDEMERRSRR